MDFGPVQHVLRAAPPWRRHPVLTECGNKIREPERLITREQLAARVRKLGQKRAAYSTCITCWEAAKDHRGWDVDPASVIARDVRYRNRWGYEDDDPMNREFRALAALVEAHLEEWDELVTGLDQTVSLDARRREARRRG